MSRRRAAVLGALTADAAAMGLHWLYEPAKLAELAKAGSLAFRAPVAANYAGVRGYFAHAGRRAGMFSQYGEVLALTLGHAAERGGRFERQAWQQRYLAYFGPGGGYVGYADKPMRGTVRNLLGFAKPEEFPEVSGIDDDQLPALASLPAVLAAAPGGENLSALAERVAALTNNNAAARAGAGVTAKALAALWAGAGMRQALEEAAAAGGETLRPLLREALQAKHLDAPEAAKHFGMPCHLSQGMPIAFHIAATAGDFAEAAEANILAGGDSCGRAILLGALMGAAGHEPPRDWVSRLENSAALLRQIEAAVAR